MRTKADRIRHAVGFETIGILICSPLASWLLGASLGHVSVLTVLLATCAMVWNYVYNLGVDRLMARYLRRLDKTFWERVVHSLGFEAGFLLVSLPLVAWWMDMSVLTALFLDLGVAVFYMVYAFLYNLAYDRLFPVVLAESQ
jgi:uncharacterized membrane protein